MVGKVRKILADKSFGFISSEGNKDFFFHKKECITRFSDIMEGDEVEFEFEQAEKGPRAYNVLKVG